MSFGMGIPFATPVIPAKAGIQSVIGEFPMACGVDSRLRGNDRTWERPCLAKDITTLRHAWLSSPLSRSISELPALLRTAA